MTVTADRVAPDPQVASDGRIGKLRPPWVSLTTTAVFAVAAVIGPALVGDRGTTISLRERLVPPLGFGGTWSHPLGTDQLGRDILARVIGGSRVALIIAVTAVTLAFAVGLVLGVLAGFRGRWVDAAIMRLVDITLAFPIILLALLFAIQFGPSLLNVIVVIVLLLWARFARVARGEALALRSREFVVASRALGARSGGLIAAHIVPNVLPPLIVLATLQVGWAILTESALSFLGAGVPPPAPAWGSMVADGRDLLREAWWVSTIPGAAIVVVTVSFNMIGDWLRDRLDPTRKR